MQEAADNLCKEVITGKNKEKIKELENILSNNFENSEHIPYLLELPTPNLFNVLSSIIIKNDYDIKIHQNCNIDITKMIKKCRLSTFSYYIEMNGGYIDFNREREIECY